MAKAAAKRMIPTDTMDDFPLEEVRATPGSNERPAFIGTGLMAEPDRPSKFPSDIKSKAVATTLFLMPDDYRRLRNHAMDSNKSFQTVALDAFDLLLNELGQDPVQRWDTRRKTR